VSPAPGVGNGLDSTGYAEGTRATAFQESWTQDSTKIAKRNKEAAPTQKSGTYGTSKLPRGQESQRRYQQLSSMHWHAWHDPVVHCQSVACIWDTIARIAGSSSCAQTTEDGGTTHVCRSYQMVATHVRITCRHHQAHCHEHYDAEHRKCAAANGTCQHQRGQGAAVVSTTQPHRPARH